ncbi:MAG: hypothetical protein LBC78_03700 [Oscillospiraceae bacterium]|jgi:hypothetical protein|nr:hypothetical protein [Oscillospiraceae bacterium]
METGVITLTNSRDFPFNDSETAVALETEIPGGRYFVMKEILSADGDAGEVRAYNTAENGFLIAFSGSAKNVRIRYAVLAEASA